MQSNKGKMKISRFSIATGVALFVLQVLFPQATHAFVAASPSRAADPAQALVFSRIQAGGTILSAPEARTQFASTVLEETMAASTPRARRTIWVLATAYSSTPDQTDSTPFIGAKGTFVRDGMVAANFLPIGTKLRIPDKFGDKEFFVEDRMNARYGSGRIDIWMPTREQAKQWGARRIKLEVW